MGDADDMKPAPRPPTPPRGSSHASPLPVKHDANQKASAAGSSPAPGPATPSAPALPHPVAGLPSVKRVDFSPAPSYIKPMTFDDDDEATPPLRIVTPSSKCKPGKSILKANNASATPTATVIESPDNAADFVRSTLQELSSEDRSSRIDAYVILARSWRAYVNMPDGFALLASVPAISRFIRRDITEVGSNYAPANINIVHQALSLLLILVWNQEASSVLPDDMKTFVIDHSIASLQSRKLPKMLVTDYLKIISFQQLPARYLTPGRTSQILTALQHLTDQVEGKAIVAQRIAVYDRLHQRVRQPFISQASLWVEHLVTAFFHPLEEIWKRAVSLALLIASEGPSLVISKALRALLDIPRDDGQRLVQTLCDRLSSMAAKRAKHVPIIWSTILLLLRSHKFDFEQWADLRDWLLVLERCFNSNDNQIRCEAFLAWGRFTFCMLPSESLHGRTLAILARPIVTQLARRRADRTVIEHAARGYNFLLYLAFHPSTSPSRLERHWHEFIVRAISRHPNHGVSLNARICKAIAALLWDAQPKPWDERKASDAEVMIEPHDLPRLDPKWVRARVVHVLSAFELLFRYTVWPSSNFGDSAIGVAWSNLCKTLADACSKEITPSADTLQAVASMMGMLQRVWKSLPSSLAVSDDDPEVVYDVFKYLYTTMATHLGAVLFTERRILKSSSEKYPTETTPTHRPASSARHMQTPTMHLVQMIFSHQPVPSQSQYISLFETILETSVKSRASTAAQLAVHRQVEEVLQSLAGPKYQAHLDRASQIVLKSARLILFSSAAPKTKEGLREQLDEVLGILSMAITLGSAPSEWRLTFLKVVNDAKETSGVEAVAPIIEVLTQPAMALLSTEMKSLGIAYCTELVQEAETVCALLAKGQLQDANAREYPESAFTSLHRLMNLCVLEICENANTDLQTSAEEFLKATMNYVDGIDGQTLPAVCAALQDGLIACLTDRKGLLVGDADNEAISASVRCLTAKISKHLWRMLKTDPTQIHTLSPIIAGGLLSSSPVTAKYFVNMWKNNLSNLALSECPADIKEALMTLDARAKEVASVAGHKTKLPDQSRDVYSRLRPRKARRKSPSIPPSDAEHLPSTVQPKTASKRPNDDANGYDQTTSDSNHPRKEANFCVAVGTPYDGADAVASTQRRTRRRSARKAVSATQPSTRLLLMDADGWVPTLQARMNDDESDTPASSPSPGSNGQSQHSLLKPRTPSPEKQVSQTEIIEETVLHRSTSNVTSSDCKQPPPPAEATAQEHEQPLLRRSARKRKSNVEDEEGTTDDKLPPARRQRTEESVAIEDSDRSATRKTFWPLDRLLRLYR